MNDAYRLSFATLVTFIVCVGEAFAGGLPQNIFSVGDITVGISTLTDVKKVYGAAAPVKVRLAEDESDVTICYAYTSTIGTSFVAFETGAMGGFKNVTGYRISTTHPRGRCTPTERDVGALTAENGIRLGQSLADFEKAIPVQFTAHGSELSYKEVGKRQPTADELKRMRASSSDESQYYFDVTIVIKARFNDRRLMDLYVHKIESF
jgi:hypothetical protein